MAPPQVPRVFLLPKNDAPTPFTIITLPHPRTSVPTRFLLDESTGLHEITKIVPAASAPRSWLLAPVPPPTPTTTPDDAWPGTGHTLADATLYITTPYDPLFLILPRLLPAVPPSTHALYQPLDALLDALSADTDTDTDTGAAQPHWDAVLAAPTARAHILSRIRAISDCVPGGDAYRPSPARALSLLSGKCAAMAAGGLPRSLEDAAVRRVLGCGVDGAVEGVENLGLSESAEQAEKMAALRALQRLRTAGEFLAGTYLASHHSAALLTELAGAHAFAALDAHLAEARRQRGEAAVLRAGDFALGGGGGGGGGAKRRKEEREVEAREERGRRRAAASRGVRDLGKANTKGMAKMTSFFKKKET